MPLSTIGSFATTNGLSINVYGVENDDKQSFPIDTRVYYCMNVCIQHYTTIRNFRRLVSSQLSNHEQATYCCKKCLQDSRAVKGSCRGLLPRTKNQVPQGSKMSIYQRTEVTTSTFCSLCRFPVDSKICQRRCRCYTWCRY